LAIYDELLKLQPGESSLPESERQFLEKIWNWRIAEPATRKPLEDTALLDAMLFASGVAADDSRTKYADEMKDLAAKAKAAVEGAKTDYERGQSLLKFLHEGVMSKGYAEEQTSLPEVFESGKFNCVSSTALYCLLGSQLDLKLQPFAIPGNISTSGHASLDLLDGKRRIQVEPTNPDGFDWAAKIKRPGVVVLGYIPDRKNGYEVDLLGIAASIYTNRGIAFDKAEPPDRSAAAHCYVGALVLDPLDGTGANNLTALINNRGLQLLEAKEFDTAVKMLGFALSLEPKSSNVENNLRSAWAEYISDTMSAGKYAQGLELVRQAAKAVPAESNFKRAPYWFQQCGEQSLQQKEWEKALQVAEKGLSHLEEKEAKELREWRSGVFRRWSQERLEQKDVEGSAEILKRAMALDESDQAIHNGLGYHTQLALKILEEAQDQAAAVKHFEILLKQFPKVNDITDAGWSYALQAVDKHADAGALTEAVQAAEQLQALVPDAKRRADLHFRPYQLCAQQLAGQKKWREALAVYAQGQKAQPKERRMVDGAANVIDAWASESIEMEKWDMAIEIYKLGLTEHAPNHPRLKQNKEYCESRKRN
jgi:tetratricopeptide (TPR) repeat protein